MDERVAKERARLEQLMAPERTRVTLREVPARVAAEEVGALDAVGYEASDPAVYAAVYIFEHPGPHTEAVEALRAGGPTGEGVRVLHAVNGRMLFFGYARIDGEDGRAARFRLSGMVSAFSGDE